MLLADPLKMVKSCAVRTAAPCLFSSKKVYQHIIRNASSVNNIESPLSFPIFCENVCARLKQCPDVRNSCGIRAVVPELATGQVKRSVSILVHHAWIGAPSEKHIHHLAGVS